MPESLRLTLTLPVPPSKVYEAWLDGAKHSAMTGAHAESREDIGSAFTAWDGYIRGEYASLTRPHRILMMWRTAEFPADAPDSSVELALDALPKGTKLTLRHTNIPDGQGDKYKAGWKEFYFEPMKRYFSAK